MNFPPSVRAYLWLFCTSVSTGIATGMGAFLSGSHWGASLVLGLGSTLATAAHALAQSPKDKVEKAERAKTTAPFANPTP